MWHPDILGPDFEATTIDLGSDEEGPLVATLVRHRRKEQRRRFFHRKPPLDGVDVLYIHGWSDYFFQYPLARFFADRGARFFALDLRKYGRSLREGQTPGFITDLADYDHEIDQALDIMAQSHPDIENRRLFLMGHSTGGLIASLWAARHRGRADAMILNAPWLEFQLKSAVRTAISPIVSLQATVRPRESIPNVDLGFYARAQQEVDDPAEPFTINAQWRPAQALPAKAAWFRAILAGHAAVHAGLNIDIPICVLLSARSATPVRWSDELTRADSVLVVDDIARAALKLGQSVTIERIDGALHDVFISRRAARAEAYRRLDRWLIGAAAAAGRDITPAPPHRRALDTQ